MTAGEGTGDGSDDWLLVAAAQDGDQTAFSDLYERHVQTVFRFLVARVGNRTVAEDLTSDTFLRALRRIDSVSYRGREIGGWFITIARNLLLDHYRSGRHRLEHLTADMAAVHPAVSPSPEDEFITAVRHAELLRCVDDLPPAQQECIRLRFMDGLSVADTAAAMKRTPGAVKAMQHRAVRALTERLSSWAPTTTDASRPGPLPTRMPHL